MQRKTLVAALLFALLSIPARAESPYAPTSFEILYQPSYSMATGGPTAQFGAAGGGIRIGYGMTKLIAFEMGAYYNGYAYGGVNADGSTQTVYGPRGSLAFALVPAPFFRLYAGIDANATFQVPDGLTSTGNKDLGALAGMRLLIGGKTKVFFGAEYRYGANTVFNYAGGTITPSLVLASFGVHFGGM